VLGGMFGVGRGRGDGQQEAEGHCGARQPEGRTC
jgi:hypothetical protein